MPDACRAFFMIEKRDFREETALNAAEWALLRTLAGQLGISKSATLRYCLHTVGNDFMRKRRASDTVETTEE